MRMSGDAKRAGECDQCGECEEKCPQDILVSEWVPRIHAALGGER